MTKEKFLRACAKSSTWKEVGECFCVSKQRAHQIGEAMEPRVMDEAKKLLFANKSFSTNIDLPKRNGLYVLYFIGKRKKFYTYGDNARASAQALLSALRTEWIRNKGLLADYKKFGEKACRFKFLGVFNSLEEWREKRRDFLSNINGKMYNISCIRDEEEMIERRRAQDKYHNNKHEKRSSGEPGIFWHRSGWWMVNLNIGVYKRAYLGYFKTLKAAKEAKEAYLNG